MRAVVLAVLLAGCGFHDVRTSGDGSLAGDGPLAGDGSTAGDFAQTGGNDFAMGPGGPGPLGALPPGYCCQNAEQCSGRRCTGGYCSTFCGADSDCTDATTQLHCDTANSVCVPAAAPFTCLDPATYHPGALATGTCCSGSLHSNEQCNGGLCISTGLDTNPYYCSQGCDVTTPCPTGYTCFGRDNGFITDLRNCWKDPTATDQTAAISCL
jgi:hypothetical protein